MKNYILDLNKLKEVEDSFKNNPISLKILNNLVENFKNLFTIDKGLTLQITYDFICYQSLIDLKILKEVKEENKVQQLNS